MSGLRAHLPSQDLQRCCRVIVGAEYYEGTGFEADKVVEMLMTFLLQKKVPRQTEGQRCATDEAASNEGPRCACQAAASCDRQLPSRRSAVMRIAAGAPAALPSSPKCHVFLL